MKLNGGETVTECVSVVERDVSFYLCIRIIMLGI